MSIKKGDADGDDCELGRFVYSFRSLLQQSAPNGDVNQDEIVNLSDLFDVLDHWLQ